MDLSIIIVNWNSRDYLRACIESIQAETDVLVYEIIVIDSASFDGCGEMLTKYFPSVKFIQSEDNLGFATSNNVAFDASIGEIVLFLNPDTELRAPAISVLYDAMLNLRHAGALGCTLLNSDGSIQTSCVKSFPTIIGEVLNAEMFRKCFPQARLWGMASLYSDSEVPSEAEVISGACLMVRRDVFELAGRFNIDYFMYSEDVELCFNIQRAGFINYHVPSATIIHHGGTSSMQSEVSAFSSVMMLEARWKYFRKTRSTGYCLLYRATVVATSLIRVGISLCLWLAAKLTMRSSRWGAALKKWWSCLRWTFGLERWVKKYES